MAQELVNLSEINLTPVDAFKPGGLEELLSRIESEARSITPDISTAKGRKAIASTAAQVARSKTYLDGLGKDLVAGLKQQTGAVDAERRAMRERLDGLKEEVRNPLTEWEEAQAAIEREIEAIKDSPDLPPESTSADIASLINSVKAIEIDDKFGHSKAQAQQAKDAALYRLNEMLKDTQAKEEAAAKAEAERKTQEEAARKAREAQIAKEAAEQATREAEERAKAEAQRVEQERQREEQARKDAEQRAATAERQRKEAEERAAQKAQDAARKERERIESEATAKRVEDTKRATDKAHRAKVNSAAANGLVESVAGISIEQARAVVTAIARNEIPAVTINY